MEQDEEITKLGQVVPREHLAEVTYQTLDGRHEVLTGFVHRGEEPDAIDATRYSYSPETGETTTEHGVIRGVVREGSRFIWEHKKGSTVVAATIAVAIGSLAVRHRRRRRS